MDVRTYVRTEKFPILQDFVPYWGHCPKRVGLVVENNEFGSGEEKLLEIERERERETETETETEPPP